MSAQETHEDAFSTLTFDDFWEWVAAHPNCILRAGIQNSVIYDDEDYHWQFAQDNPETLLVQVIRGKRLWVSSPSIVSESRMSRAWRGTRRARSFSKRLPPTKPSLLSSASSSCPTASTPKSTTRPIGSTELGRPSLIYRRLFGGSTVGKEGGHSAGWILNDAVATHFSHILGATQDAAAHLLTTRCAGIDILHGDVDQPLRW